MLVRLHGKGLEPALVQMSGASGAVVRMPMHRVRHRQPAKERTDLIVLVRTHHEVPMFGITASAKIGN